MTRVVGNGLISYFLKFVNPSDHLLEDIPDDDSIAGFLEVYDGI
jgi:hypothetical protein